MEIRINKLRMQNFKGVRSAEYSFDGQNARIEGPNGSGKSTVFDAFTWLIFGKDHRGNSTETFEIKTIDPATGKPTPRQEHWVEAELSVDGRTTTLRRVWLENWVKPTGEVEEVMRGHTSRFLVDGVDVGAKKSYDSVVNGWMNEDMFKMLTNPHYFIDDDITPWKARRKALMDLVNDSQDLASVQTEFADLINELSGRSVDEFRKRLTLEKNANKKDLEILNNKIAGIRENLPELVDEAEVRKQLAAYQESHDNAVAAVKEDIKRIDQALAGGDGADAKRKAENDAIWREITAVQLWMSNRVAEARNAALEKNKAHEKALYEAKAYLSTATSKCTSTKMHLDNLQDNLKERTAQRGSYASDLQDLGVQYDKEKEKAFSHTAETTCPHCGQEIPAATVAEAREKAHQHFLAERKAAMDAIIMKAKAIREKVEALDDENGALKLSIDKAQAEYMEAVAQRNELAAEVDRLSAEPMVDVNEAEREVRNRTDFREKALQEQELRVKASNTAPRLDDADDLMQEKSTLEGKISALDATLTLQTRPLQDLLAKNAVRNEQLSAIAKMEREARTFADAIARDERLEARAAEYTKAQIDSVDKAISGLFHVARWKMFDRTLDGGIVEMCDVTSPDGVPYKSMNDAMKILCGLDVIRVFSERYGRKAPIFVDNAEGVLTTRFDTDAQIIRLVVKDAPAITLTKE